MIRKPSAQSAALTALSLVVAGSVHAAVTATASGNHDSADVRISWSDAITFTQKTSDRELLLTFNKPLDAASDMSDLPKNADLLENVQYGYDSLVLRSRVPAEFTVTQGGGAITVHITRKALEPLGDAVKVASVGATPAPSPSANEKEEAQLRNDLLRANLKAQDGQLVEARRDLDRLYERNPDNAEIANSLASVEERLGRNERAIMIYNHILAKNPYEPGAVTNRMRLLQKSRPQIYGGTEWYKARNADRQFISRAGFDNLMAGPLRIGGEAEHRKVWARSARLPDNTTDGYYKDRDKLRTTFEFDVDPSLTLQGALILSHSPGAEVGAEFKQQGQSTKVTVVGHEPYWDNLDELVGNATRDRVTVSHHHEINDRLNWNGTLSGNNYNTSGASSSAQSVLAQSSFSYLLAHGKGDLFLEYGIDGEYMLSRDRKTDSLGNRYRPISVTTREAHSLSLSWVVAQVGSISYSLFGGYSADRYGADGAFGGARINIPVNDRVGIEAYASSNQADRGTGGVSNRVGVQADLKF